MSAYSKQLQPALQNLL